MRDVATCDNSSNGEDLQTVSIQEEFMSEYFQSNVSTDKRRKSLERKIHTIHIDIPDINNVPINLELQGKEKTEDDHKLPLQPKKSLPSFMQVGLFTKIAMQRSKKNKFSSITNNSGIEQQQQQATWQHSMSAVEINNDDAYSSTPQPRDEEKQEEEKKQQRLSRSWKSILKRQNSDDDSACSVSTAGTFKLNGKNNDYDIESGYLMKHRKNYNPPSILKRSYHSPEVLSTLEDSEFLEGMESEESQFYIYFIVAAAFSFFLIFGFSR